MRRLEESYTTSPAVAHAGLWGGVAPAERGGSRGYGATEVERGNGAVAEFARAAAKLAVAAEQCGGDPSDGKRRPEFAGVWRRVGVAWGERGRECRQKEKRGGELGDGFYRGGKVGNDPSALDFAGDVGKERGKVGEDSIREAAERGGRRRARSGGAERGGRQRLGATWPSEAGGGGRGAAGRSEARSVADGGGRGATDRGGRRRDFIPGPTSLSSSRPANHPGKRLSPLLLPPGARRSTATMDAGSGWWNQAPHSSSAIDELGQRIAAAFSFPSFRRASEESRQERSRGGGRSERSGDGGGREERRAAAG
uniref:Uncharacterized protein n=1 Tax=Oryza sativa subsp. japonica TaxID=39947 RepID=Q84Z99_ORYSJ|nr:hypothetical protein [Oryza sativa Japonica Group]BAD10328.1 hypothetical protein [Oryza sativa Japonica Group]